MQSNLAASPQQLAPLKMTAGPTPQKARTVGLGAIGPPQPHQHLSLGTIARRETPTLSNFPGATGPGSGARHFPGPEEVGSRWDVADSDKERAENFEMKTTADFYRDFPGLVRSSTPLYIKSAGIQEPLGKVEQGQQDAGPTTGHRRMPEAVDSEGRQRPRLPSHPDTSKTALLRERDSRHRAM